MMHQFGTLVNDLHAARPKVPLAYLTKRDVARDDAILAAIGWCVYTDEFLRRHTRRNTRTAHAAYCLQYKADQRARNLWAKDHGLDRDRAAAFVYSKHGQADDATIEHRGDVHDGDGRAGHAHHRVPVDHRWEPEGGWEVRHIRLRALGFASYDKYRQSPHWRKTRQQAILDAGNTCQDCWDLLRGELWLDKLEVHHQTYKRLGDERVGDLRVLCRICHSITHFGGPSMDEQMEFRRRAEEQEREGCEERERHYEEDEWREEMRRYRRDWMKLLFPNG